MSKGPIRRSQLIAPFGVGSIVVAKDGIALMTAGLDVWFDNQTSDNINKDSFKIFEWRLQERLGVSYFMSPPDFRRLSRGMETENTNIKLPFVRFPQWHYCTFCKSMEKHKLHTTSKYIRCHKCQINPARTFAPTLIQVPFVAICEDGHIQDFPWCEWAHYGKIPSETCRTQLEFHSTGQSGMRGLKVRCKHCSQSGKLVERNLGRISSPAGRESTYLSKNLLRDKDEDFLCQGHQPWLGRVNHTDCKRPLLAQLSSASNVYYSQVISSIYIPDCKNKDIGEIIDIIKNDPIMRTLLSIRPDAITVDMLTSHSNAAFKKFDDSQKKEALEFLKSGKETDVSEDSSEISDEQKSKKAEYKVLIEERDEFDLKITSEPLEKYSDENFPVWFDKINLITRLKETRVFDGFSRLMPTSNLSSFDRRKMLRRNLPAKEENWLPAHVVYGEGIFFKFNDKQINKWLKKPNVIQRISKMKKRYESVNDSKYEISFEITPRMVLIHTFSHILINRLIFDCGYSASALKEKLYISDDPKDLMSGVLIYTASGDSEGTMGGLVKLGRPGFLELTLSRALDEAGWCSNDPLCMETGDEQGQGPDYSNIAACHNCTLLPETSCEVFNRFLDRGVVIGDLVNSSLGYFDKAKES
jgi:hypothetical protein